MLIFYVNNNIKKLCLFERNIILNNFSILSLASKYFILYIYIKNLDG